MDIFANKSILIAVGLLITITVATGTMLVVNEARKIYGEVDKTSVSATEEYDNIFNVYNGTQLNGVGLINVIKRYEGSKHVAIEYPDCDALREDAALKTPPQREAVYLNTIMEKGNDTKYTYQKTYKVSANYIENSNQIKIIFEE